MYFVACYILGGTLLTSLIVSVTKQDSWLAVILGFAVSALIAWLILTLAQNFPGKTLIQINDIVFGNVLGKTLSVIYILFFLIGACLDIRDIGNFLTGLIMPETPLVAIFTLFVFVCGYGVFNGILVLARCSFIIVVILLSVLLFDTLLLIPNMNFANFAPAFTLPLRSYIQGIHTMSLIPFDGVLTLLMIFPSVDQKVSLKKPIFIGILIGTIAMLVAVIRDWAVLGSTMPMMTSPSFQALSLINVAEVFTRMEIFGAAALMAIRFFRSSVQYYAFTYSISQLFHLRSYKPLVIICGIIIICVSAFLFASSMEMGYFGTNIGAVFNTFFIVILPAITLITARTKGLGKKGRKE